MYFISKNFPIKRMCLKIYVIGQKEATNSGIGQFRLSQSVFMTLKFIDPGIYAVIDYLENSRNYSYSDETYSFLDHIKWIRMT